jgi:hypothetical protein
MKAEQQLRTDFLYEQQLTNLKLQGKRPETIDASSRAVRRIIHHFDKAPDTHYWSTVRVDRNGLQFFSSMHFIVNGNGLTSLRHNKTSDCLRNRSLIVVMLGGGISFFATWISHTKSIGTRILKKRSANPDLLICTLSKNSFFVSLKLPIKAHFHVVV